MDSILKLSDLHKQYLDVTALKKINLDIKKGTIFGLLGPNGAGKSSMIKIITNITVPDEGKVEFNFNESHSSDPMDNIGYLPEERGLYPDMKIMEQLVFFGRIKGLDKKQSEAKINYWFKRFEVEDWAHKKARELSKGMQQVVQFITCVLHDPELIILDEPFSGLDPINSNRLKKEIIELKNQGKTLILSTHQMGQVEELCSDIALIDKGEFILEGKLTEIKERFKKNIFEIKYHGDFPDLNREGFEIETHQPGVALVRMKAQISYSQILKRLSDFIEIYSFMELYPSLNDIFIEQVTMAKQGVVNE
jgi:ABC-2 type transport system ATP-binding protein